MNIDYISNNAIQQMRNFFNTCFSNNVLAGTLDSITSPILEFVYGDGCYTYIVDNIENIKSQVALHEICLFHRNDDADSHSLREILIREALSLPGTENLYYKFKHFDKKTADIINDIRIKTQYPLIEFKFIEVYICSNIFSILYNDYGYARAFDGKDNILYTIMNGDLRQYFSKVQYDVSTCNSIQSCIDTIAKAIAQHIHEIKCNFKY